MGKIFFFICGTVLVLNVFLLLLPEGKNEKYANFVVGLLVILISAELIFNIKVDPLRLSFLPSQHSTYNQEPIQNVVQQQVIAREIETAVQQSWNVSCTVQIQNENIVVCDIPQDKQAQIIDWFQQKYDINRENIMLQ